VVYFVWQEKDSENKGAFALPHRAFIVQHHAFEAKNAVFEED